jgi:hypothetical protein
MADAYVVPAARVLTVLHRPDPDSAPAIIDGVADGWTACGLPMLTVELWVPVERRDGDRVCAGCAAPGRAAEDVQEALL